MVLTKPREAPVKIERFLGQDGRSPIGSVGPGAAVVAEGSFHDSQFLRSARGSAKLVSSPMPPSAYELNGIATGIVEVPAVEGYESAWSTAIGAQDKAIGIAAVVRALNLGDLSSTAGDQGQLIFATATQIGAHPSGGADINSLRVGLVIASGKYTLRLTWGTSQRDYPLEDLGSGAPFDMTKDIGIVMTATRGIGSNTLRVQASQGALLTLDNPLALAQDWVVHQFWVGGAMPSRRPYFGIERPCHCVVSEVNIFANTAGTAAPAGWLGAGVYAARLTTPVTTATQLLDAWHLTETGAKIASHAGRIGHIVGNRAHRETGVTSVQTGGVYFDGSGALILPQAQRLRETPKDRLNGGVEGHYLELPAFTIGMWLNPRRIPWRHHTVNRACFLSWSTPKAENLGVPTDPAGASGLRPSEHLRAEIERVGSTYYLRVFFGELEPESLKHPTGTVGGQTSTAWPPALSSAGEPPATWNKPQGDPTVAHGSANGKTAFQIQLGLDSDPTHPMSYGWLVFLQRKFVAQGSGSNAVAVFVRRIALDGTLDTGFGEVKDTNADSNGERHPTNQSCFSAARLNGNDLNFLPDQYALSLGAGIGSQYGDEKKSYDGTTKVPGCYPADSQDATVFLSDECEAFPFIGTIASPFVLGRYLESKDRALIATSGRFGPEMRLHFGAHLLFSLNAEEPAGNILREARGNDCGFATRFGVSKVLKQALIELPGQISSFPRPEPSWHNEITRYAGEFGAVNGVVQRIDATGREELYAIAQAGLYAYSRSGHALARVATLPGQGGPGQASWAVDHNDVLHIAGGAGRPVLITRDSMLALSGMNRPFYYAPASIITAKKTITGGLTVDFQFKTDANPNNLLGYEIDDQAIVKFAIGYWSEALRTRSRPGPVIAARYVNPNTLPGTVTGAAQITKYRLTVAGLPPPSGPDAQLITHWEIYRTDSNGTALLLERRIPISESAVTTLIGDVQTLGEEADFLREIPPEGMAAIVTFGERLIGVSPPEFPRSIYYTKLRDPTAWPPIYRRNLNETPSPAVGAIVRRDRAFAFSRDHFYQVLDQRVDADPAAGVVTSVDVSPLIRGCGALSHFAVVSDDDNGIYVPGAKTIYLTEGGTYRSVSIRNDSSAEDDTDDHWSWPRSWDLSDPEKFVSFHDERRRMIGIAGPAADDPTRIDALVLFYEDTDQALDGRMIASEMQMSRIQGVGMRSSASVIDPTSGSRETWFGTDLGYLCRMTDGSSLGVDYDWLPTVTPKLGLVLDAATPTTLRLDMTYTGLPATDLFRGAVLRLYRDDVLISARRIESAVVSTSWVDVTLNGNHSGDIGDTWKIGAIPFDWVSGKMDFGTLLEDKAVQSADLAMAD